MIVGSIILAIVVAIVITAAVVFVYRQLQPPPPRPQLPRDPAFASSSSEMREIAEVSRGEAVRMARLLTRVQQEDIMLSSLNEGLRAEIDAVLNEFYSKEERRLPPGKD